MLLNLQDKSAIVLGGSKGLGFGIADAFHKEGAKVVVSSRSAEAAAAAANTIGSGARGLSCDTGDIASVDAFQEAALDILKHVDILVLNSGGPPAGSALQSPVAAYRTAFESLFAGPVHLALKLVPAMMERGFGRIIVVGSSGMIEPIDNLAISNSIRAAIAGWSKTLAKEVAARGVTVNIIMPGRIATDRIAELDQGSAERSGKSLVEVQRLSRARIPAGRYGTIEEFGAAAAFLASPQAAFITGSVLRLDGGQVSSIF